jgi:hypothetical protein
MTANVGLCMTSTYALMYTCIQGVAGGKGCEMNVGETIFPQMQLIKAPNGLHTRKSSKTLKYIKR